MHMHTNYLLLLLMKLLITSFIDYYCTAPQLLLINRLLFLCIICNRDKISRNLIKRLFVSEAIYSKKWFPDFLIDF